MRNLGAGDVSVLKYAPRPSALHPPDGQNRREMSPAQTSVEASIRGSSKTMSSIRAQATFHTFCLLHHTKVLGIIVLLGLNFVLYHIVTERQYKLRETYVLIMNSVKREILLKWPFYDQSAEYPVMTYPEADEQFGDGEKETIRAGARTDCLRFGKLDEDGSWRCERNDISQLVWNNAREDFMEQPSTDAIRAQWLGSEFLATKGKEQELIGYSC